MEAGLYTFKQLPVNIRIIARCIRFHKFVGFCFIFPLNCMQINGFINCQYAIAAKWYEGNLNWIVLAIRCSWLWRLPGSASAGATRIISLWSIEGGSWILRSYRLCLTCNGFFIWRSISSISSKLAMADAWTRMYLRCVLGWWSMCGMGGVVFVEEA